MMNELYRLFRVCFPKYPASEDVFNEQLKPECARIIFEYDKDRLVGYSLIHGNSISLLCMDPNYRNRGIGSRLLKSSEELIRQTDAQTILLGRGKHYLLQGVPADEPLAQRFFEHRGYSADWVSVNMELYTDEWDRSALVLPSAPARLGFRFADAHDRPALLTAVGDAHADWVRIFQTCNDPILLATLDGRIVGFAILNPNGGRFGDPAVQTGDVGCVGVIHSARNLGIGRQMVAHGIEWLKLQGCDTVELRYVALVDWYERVGFRVKHRLWMGEKAISRKQDSTAR
ncbi:MAG: GNAT family N-acetyltransferase [Clostridia bacterium]|nr:GNAT family N-acetyltransferase [Clostridia bacterium]